MNGLYIHIPFCSKICGYCDFSTVASAPRLFDEYVDLLLREAEARFALDESFVQSLESVYFGGGTPSVLPPRKFERLVRGLENLGVRFSSMREVNIECNPDSASEETLENALVLGVNRFSLGIQTFNDTILKEIGRRGSAEESRAALKRLKKLFSVTNTCLPLRITADLMFWLPGQTLECFVRDVRELAETGIGHVSFYGLTLNANTVLGRRAKQKKIVLDEDLYPQMYAAGVKTLAEYDIERYEVSNFAKLGEESLHNRNYWLRGEYLGLGPGAHSFRGELRTAAPALFPKWKNWVLSGCKTAEMDVDRLGKKERIDEKIWLALRTREGLNLQVLENEEFTRISCQKIEKWIRKGYLQKNGSTISLCGDGWLFMDSVVEDLLPMYSQLDY